MQGLTLVLKVSFRRNSTLILAAFLTLNTALGQTAPAGVRELPLGKSVGREIRAGEPQQYRLALRRGQVLSVELEEQGFDLKVELVRSPGGQSVVTANLGGGFEREAVTFVAEEGGQYLLRLSGDEAEAGNGRYRFLARLADSATERDEARFRAEKLLAEAAGSQKENTAEKIRAAIAMREQALTLWRGLGDKYWESHTLNRLGSAHAALSENIKALAYLEQALQIIRDLGDRKIEAASLNGLGQTLNVMGDAVKAVDYHDRARALFEAEKYDLGAVGSIYYTGNAYVEIDDKPKAVEQFEKGLALARKLKNRAWEAQFLNSLGYMADLQNNKTKAVALYNEALPLWPAVGNDNGRAGTLTNLGRTYLSQGDADKALAHLIQALTLFESEKNRGGETGSLLHLSSAYEKRGETEKAVAALKRLVAIYHDLGIRPLEIMFISNIATQYESIGKYEEAIEYANKCIAIEPSLPEGLAGRRRRTYEEVMRTSKGFSMMTLGRIYENLNDLDKSLQNHQAALAIFEKEPEKKYKQLVWAELGAIAQLRGKQYQWEATLDYQGRALKVAEEIGSKSLVATSFNSLGLTYGALGDKAKQLESFEKSLAANLSAANKSPSDKDLEGSVLNNIGTFRLQAGEPDAALEYHGRALKIYEEVKAPQYLDKHAKTLQNIGNVHSYLGENVKALGLYQRALGLFRQAPAHIRRLARNRTGEGSILNNIGVAHGDLGDNRQAMDSYRRALDIAVEGKDAGLASTALQNIATVHYKTGEPQQALEVLGRALALNRLTADRAGEMSSHSKFGLIYSTLMDKSKAIESVSQALTIARQISDKRQETIYLNRLGVIYSFLGENEKAFDLNSRALEISKQIGAKDSIATSLNNLAIYYSNRGERGKALSFFEQALALARESGDKPSEATFLSNIAFDYAELGEVRQALEYYDQSLKLRRETGNKREQSYALNGIGGVYLSLGTSEKKAELFGQALDSFEQSLKLAREVGDKEAETAALSGVGRAYAAKGDAAQGLAYLTESLHLAEKYQSKFQKDFAYLSLGSLHKGNRHFNKAVEAYERALTLARQIDDKDVEAKALKGLMSALRGQGHTRLAILYGKQAVNGYQRLRAEIGSLRKETQRIYREKVTDAYRELADLLIVAGRLAEAEQVLEMLKEEELLSYLSRDASETGKLQKRIDLSDEERDALTRYQVIADKVAALGEEFAKLQGLQQELKRQGGDLTEEQKQRLQFLSKATEDANRVFGVFLRQLADEFAKRPGVILAARGNMGLRRDLKKWGEGVVFLHTLVAEDRYRVILTTARAQADGKKEIKAAELDEKIRAFRAAVQNPAADPRPLGKELYDILVGPVERQLQGAGAETLLWSLDGNLRLLPLAALWDGRQYLGQRFRNVTITPVSRTRLGEPAAADWRVLGLGVSEARTVTVKEPNGTRNIPFSALPAVRAELASIIRSKKFPDGLLPGRILLDSEFNAAGLKRELSEGYNVVHIASHFSLNPGDMTKSFLLMGDGSALTVSEIKASEEFQFGDVELLTLSACRTAVGEEDGTGKEIEGFGYVAQEKGAKAILATLWGVADESTQLLMSEFYRLRKEHPSLTKAAALQAAQQGMIVGRLKPTGGKVNQRETGEADVMPDYSHPYYWSPFVLIGNWR